MGHACLKIYIYGFSINALRGCRNVVLIETNIPSTGSNIVIVKIGIIYLYPCPHYLYIYYVVYLIFFSHKIMSYLYNRCC